MARRFLALFFPLMVACSSTESPADGGSESSAKDVAIDVVIDPGNCVAPGTLGNDHGMGGYCSPGGGQCVAAGPGGAPRICSGDLAQTPAHEWYCTNPCSGPSDCGASAQCLAMAQGSFCVPDACVPLVPDAGSDAAVDAPDQ